MRRIALFAWLPALALPLNLCAMPAHEFRAGLSFIGGKPGLDAEYAVSNQSGQVFRLAGNLDTSPGASLKYQAPGSGFIAIAGSGSPANSAALRSNPIAGKAYAGSIPWTLSRAGSGNSALGVKIGALDSILVFAEQPKTESPPNSLLGELSALGVQVSAQGKAMGGGLAFSLADLAREERDEGWADGLYPLTGGLFATMSCSGRLVRSGISLELWGSACAGALEPPGAAISALGEWESLGAPRYAIKLFTFLSFPGYRVWTGKALEWDLAASATINGSWDRVSALIEGKVFSEANGGRRADWRLGRASISLDFRGFGNTIGCDAGFSAFGLDSASASLCHSFEIAAIPRGKLDLNLSAAKGKTDTYSTGLALGWRLAATSASAGKASMTLRCERALKGLLVALSGELSQEFPIRGLGSLTLGLKSPENGYAFGGTRFELPELELGISLRIPPS